jgi:signal transduction histidine kinase
VTGSPVPGIRRAGLGARLRTLRARVTIVASIAITAAVVLGFLLLYLLQTDGARRTIDGQLGTYITQIEQSATNRHWPAPLPPSTLDANAEAQVLDTRGHVLAATRTLTGRPAIYLLPAGATQPVRQQAADGVIPTDVQVVATRTAAGGRPVTIIAGTSTGLLQQLSTEFAARLLLAIPVVLILAAVAVWLIVGRALRPVEHIRRAVTEITSADLSQRVPEPGTADEIGYLAHTMNDMLGRLDDSARRQRRFVADASHELRTPLAAIRTTLDVGLAYPDRAPWPVIAERAATQSARLEELIQQLLLLAKADERQLSARRDAVDLAAILHDTMARLPGHQVEIELRAGTNLKATGDASHLERLFRNIIDNALRYAASRVVISATVSGDIARIEIDDDGPGIPAADRSRVFDRFVRLDSSRERGTGTTGLGLAIAREIALAHNGEITLLERPGGGTRAVVTLPLRQLLGPRCQVPGRPPGSHQFHRPMIATSAGTSRVRTTTASMKMPTPSPVAIISTTTSGALLSEAKEIARITAAQVTRRPVRASAPTTAPRVDRVRSYSSRIRARMNTS